MLSTRKIFKYLFQEYKNNFECARCRFKASSPVTASPYHDTTADDNHISATTGEREVLECATFMAFKHT
jgi:transcription elongation factor Elf1